MAVVWLECKVYSGWHPMSKGTWDTGGGDSQKKGENKPLC